MPFSIRPSRRFPVCCPVTYHCGNFEGHGTRFICPDNALYLADIHHNGVT